MEATTVPAILQQMLIDIQDPACHYIIYNNYFDIQPPPAREDTRWYQAQLFLDHGAIRHTEFVEDGMLCDVILQNQLPAQWERIRIPYAQIYAIRRFLEGQPITDKDSYLYQDSSKLKMPPLSKAREVAP